MNDYSPPPESTTDFAPLTSSLLARKGEAAPAFDTDAYAEVMNGQEFTAPISPIFDKHEPRVCDLPAAPERVALKRSDGEASHGGAALVSNVRMSAQTDAPPRAAETPATHQNAAPLRRPVSPGFRAAKDGARHASVTFRMPREELVRLRRAAKKLDMSCLQILLDAVECYLDANDVQPVKNAWSDGQGQDY